jgi:protein tyrosine phosphatase (PTP) superfamily phosphohydrolase (DUF442 family)
MNTTLRTVLVAALLTWASGCHHCCHQPPPPAPCPPPCPVCPPPCTACPPRPGVVIPGRPAPGVPVVPAPAAPASPGFITPPAPGVPASPAVPGTLTVPPASPAAPGLPGASVPPGPPAAGDSRIQRATPEIPPDVAWQPFNQPGTGAGSALDFSPQPQDGIKLYPPESAVPGPATERAERTEPQAPPAQPMPRVPETPAPPLAGSGQPADAVPPQQKPAEPPPLVVQPPPAGNPEKQPGGKEERPPAPSLPVDIPQFTTVKDRVAAGLKPYPDGLQWLKDNGYRTVLHLRHPGEDDNADRKQVEKHGLTYLSLEVSPETLTRELAEQFNAVVNDAGKRPLFVYDKDGVLAGGMWYLYFRLAEGLGENEALTRARRLGLREEQEGEGRRMWLAIQQVLSNLKK